MWVRRSHGNTVSTKDEPFFNSTGKPQLLEGPRTIADDFQVKSWEVQLDLDGKSMTKIELVSNPCWFANMDLPFLIRWESWAGRLINIDLPFAHPPPCLPSLGDQRLSVLQSTALPTGKVAVAEGQCWNFTCLRGCLNSSTTTERTKDW